MPRITDFQYVPTEADILRLPAHYEYAWNKSLQETRLSLGKLSMHVIGCSGDSQSQKSDWIPHFRDVTGVIFVVDLCSYDQTLPPSPHNIKLMKCLDLFNVIGSGRSIYTKLMESLYLFEAVANSRLYQESSIFLFFTGLEALQKKLIESPLLDHFSDYGGGRDVDEAVGYIFGLFKKINRLQLHIYSEILPLDNEDRFQLDPVLEAVSNRLMPNLGDGNKLGEEGTRIQTAPYHPRFTAKICAMALSKPTMYAAHGTALPALC